MPERMKPYSLSAALLLLFVYLGVQALTGERGLLSGASRDALMHQRQAELTALTERRADLEVRARYLRTGSLSRDLLEERALAVLGFGVASSAASFVFQYSLLLAHWREWRIEAASTT